MNAWTLWITGLPGSGKSTIAQAVQRKLENKGIHSQILSSDELRKFMTPKPTYSEQERRSIYSTLVFIAKLLNENNVNIIIDATGNLRKYRTVARNTLKNFAIAYAKCCQEVCIEREKKRKETFGAPKNIYNKGRTGKSTTVPGINLPYEQPLNAEIVIETDKISIDDSAEKLYNFILNFFNCL